MRRYRRGSVEDNKHRPSRKSSNLTPHLAVNCACSILTYVHNPPPAPPLTSNDRFFPSAYTSEYCVIIVGLGCVVCRNCLAGEPQQKIARIARREPEKYAACDRVSLVSSFVSSILAGRYCSIDASDASGMNLMDIRYVCTGTSYARQQHLISTIIY